ncbi:tRNA adenosine(34) deaminase TadA [Petroclostridium sp. X23]|uniref:tRNA adenosine(34) deaminase TadA n=1 Tax=Petroclostridium sp. X23 TaxID=3045146 RepID=UPI0024AD35DA|nr:tRNA adenosine(34) deaminase TadA [Petroclostridium sp. X23]WHH57282.1 tRNA adenosine(34) deaminase TadA [Petroclostridium sp. X23]
MIENGEFTIRSYEYYMRYALKEAEKAYQKDEVPIGAVIVKNDKIIAKAHNLREKSQDAIAHAEVLAIRKACKKLHSWRLSGCDLYVTLEPCAMCAGAIIQSRIGQLIIGTMDPKAGAGGSVVNLFGIEQFNHKVDVIQGVLQQECADLLKRFFRELRQRN